MEDDTSSILSFQDLEEDPRVTEPYYRSSFPSPSKQDDFEFSVTGESASRPDTVLFCGKAIPSEKPGYVLQSNAYFERFRSFRRDSNDARLPGSGSLRSPSSRAVVPSTWSSQRSPSFKRKYMALIGVTKFPSRMDMGEIRRRQSRQAPASLFPLGSDSEDTAALASGGGRGHRHWSLSRPLRCRSNLVTALARASICCMRQA